MMSFTPIITNQIPFLGDGDIHVWCVDLDVVAQGANLAILSAHELEKANKLRRPEHKAHSLSMKLQLRLLLSGYMGVLPSEVSFSALEFGKPVVDNSALAFNVSHSGSTALVAISLNNSIGVDIENWRYLDNLEGLVLRNFSSDEQEQWLSIPDHQREKTFFDIWTCKEAFIKATGRGLGMGVSRCGFSFDPPNKLIECPEEYGEISEWSCLPINMEGQVSASLIMRSKNCKPAFYLFDPENLPHIV